MNTVARLSAGLLAGLFVTTASAEAQSLDRRREKILARDMNVVVVTPPGAVTTADLPVPSAPMAVRSIRLHLRLVNPGTGPFTLIVSNAAGTEVERFDAGRFVGNEYWTDEIPGGHAHVRMNQNQSGAQIEVDKFATGITQVQPQALIGKDDSLTITDPGVPSTVKQWSPAIARIKFITAGDVAGGFCTGFLLGADLLLTNQHCISNDSEAASARVEFGVDSTAAVPVKFRVTAIEAVDGRLDFSLVRLSASASKFGRLFLGPAVSSQLAMAVIQHPQGNPKRAAFPPNCFVGSTSVAGVDDVLNDFGHSCDTLGGSSGSPVVDSIDGLVRGLHHWRWPDGAKDPENQAVHIGLIVKYLDGLVQSEKDPAKQKRLKAIFDEVTRARPAP